MNEIDTRLKPEEWKPPLIAAIGMGIGPQCLGPLALEWISAAQILTGSRPASRTDPRVCRGKTSAKVSSLREPGRNRQDFGDQADRRPLLRRSFVLRYWKHIGGQIRQGAPRHSPQYHQRSGPVREDLRKLG